MTVCGRQTVKGVLRRLADFFGTRCSLVFKELGGDARWIRGSFCMTLSFARFLAGLLSPDPARVAATCV